MARVLTNTWFWIALAVALHAAAVRAYEVDNFSDRDTLREDALPVLDRRVNHFLERAVREANQESPRHCNRVMLRQEVLRWVRPDPISILELWAAYTNELQHTQTPVGQSIYAGATLRDSMAIWVGGIGRSMKVNGHIIGTDKLGHFFMQGHDYFKLAQDGRPIEKIMREDHGEDGIWGMPMTGVKSYADMAANFQGFKFWSEFYSGPNPYVRCEGGNRWVKVRNFTWADYVSDAWDEAINCSDFGRRLEAKVEQNLARKGLHCPLKPDACRDIARLEKSDFFISPKCQAALPRPASTHASSASSFHAQPEDPVKIHPH